LIVTRWGLAAGRGPHPVSGCRAGHGGPDAVPGRTGEQAAERLVGWRESWCGQSRCRPSVWMTDGMRESRIPGTARVQTCQPFRQLRGP